MFKKTVYILPLFFLFIHEVTGQTISCQKVISSAYSVSNALCERTLDGGYIVCSSVQDSSQDGILAIKMDYFGNIEWSKIYKATGSLYAVTLKVRGPDDILICGYSTACSAGSADELIMDIDYSGSIKWTRIIGNTMFEMGMGIAITSDKGCIVVGTSDSYNMTNMWYINRLDSMGNILWSKLWDYPSGGVNTIYISKSIDGNFFLTGSVGNNSSFSFDLLLMKMDPSGNIIWSKSFDSGSGNDEGGIDLFQDSSGSIYVGGTRSFLAMNFEITFTKFNSIGNKIWTRSYGGAGNEWVRGFCFDHHSLNAVGFTSSYSSKMMFVKADTNGNIIKEKVFQGSDFCSVNPGNDAGLLMASPKNNFSTGLIDLYIIKSDSMGVSGCNEIDVIDTALNYILNPVPINISVFVPVNFTGSCSIQTANLNVTDSTICYLVGIPDASSSIGGLFSVYPNPSNDILNIDYMQKNLNTSYEVYDILGKKVLAGKLESFGKNYFSVKGLSDGLYIIRVVDGDAILSKKFMKE